MLVMMIAIMKDHENVDHDSDDDDVNSHHNEDDDNDYGDDDDIYVSPVHNSLSYIPLLELRTLLPAVRTPE